MSELTNGELFTIALGAPGTGGKRHTRGEALRAVFDAGRASRDAEVAGIEGELEGRTIREQLANGNWAKAVARAEAAEAVIAAVKRVLDIPTPDSSDFTAPLGYIEGALDAHGWWHSRVGSALATYAPAVSHPEPTKEAGPH